MPLRSFAGLGHRGKATASDSKPPTHREDPSGERITDIDRVTATGISGPEFFTPGLSVTDTTRNVDSTELRLNDGGAQAPDDKKANDRKCPRHGNPIILATGNKTEPEQDFTSAGEMPLHLQRVWNQHWDGVGCVAGDPKLGKRMNLISIKTAGKTS